jgi:hypothetical protein
MGRPMKGFSMALARLLLGTSVSAAILASSIVPADARPPRRGHHGGWHHRDRGVDGGDILAGAVILGGIAAIAGMSAKKDRQVDDQIAARNGDAYADRSDDGEWRGTDSADRDDSTYTEPADAAEPAGASTDDYAQVIRGEDEAVDACARAAESEALSYGSNANVRDIADVQGEGTEWRVSGTVETRNGYRERPDARGFTCTVRYGQIENVRLDGSVAMR